MTNSHSFSPQVLDQALDYARQFAALVPELESCVAQHKHLAFSVSNTDRLSETLASLLALAEQFRHHVHTYRKV